MLVRLLMVLLVLLVPQTSPLPIPSFIQQRQQALPSSSSESVRVVSVDSMYLFSLLQHSNDFLEVVRLLSNETLSASSSSSRKTRSVQQTDLFSLSADFSPLSLSALIRHEYCPGVKNTLYELCVRALEDSLLSKFSEHSARELQERREVRHTVHVVDKGFHRRIAIPGEGEGLGEDERLKERRPILPDQHFYFDKKNKKNMNHNLAGDIAVVVSGYWPVEVSKYGERGESESIGNRTGEGKEASHFSGEQDEAGMSSMSSPEKYMHWFEHSLKINMPYIVFTSADVLPYLLSHREHLPSLFIAYETDQFHVKAEDYGDGWINEKHVPSKEVARIWLEKVNLVYLASQLHDKPFYIWVDAAISSYRNEDPPPFEWSKEVLLSLPKNRISYSFVSGEYHSFAATVMVFPRTMVLLGHHLFYKAFEKCCEIHHDWRCGSEQFLWSQVREHYPEIFHPMSYDYGEIDFLWGSNRQD